MKKIKFKEGSTIIYNEVKYSILKVEQDNVELINDFGELEKVSINQLNKTAIRGIKVLSSFEPDNINIARKRLEIIKPLLGKKGSRADVQKLSNEKGVSTATIYRWLKKYKETELMSSLTPENHSGGKGKSRLEKSVDAIIDANINEHYLTNQRKSIKKVYLEIKLECRERNLEPPHYNTVRRRITALSEYKTVKYRLGKTKAKKKFTPKLKSFPDGLFPLSSIQVDHTPLDIIVVDEKHREAIGRPWLTLAIDTFSRMVVGFYIGFERPNSMSVGLCLSQAILPKEEFLAKMDIYSSWPCYGRIKTIHVDNALEFRSKMLEDACLEYKMDINWRPVKVPEYGGIIERLLGTFSNELHQLKGTTFSNLKDRGDYDSEKEAVFTYEELEKWITLYIVEVYHQGFHSGIGTSPINKWKEGVLGSDEMVGVGYQPVNVDRRKVLLDFMPYELRTIQDYGILIDGIHYYSDILRPWINSVDIKTGKLRAKRKFKFKRDPRDISLVFFLDPSSNEYFPIPYRDTSRPPITKWELKAIREKLTKDGLKFIDEDAIFAAYKKLKEIESSAARETKKARRLKVVKKKQKEHYTMVNPIIGNNRITNLEEDIFNSMEPFDDIENG